MADLQRDLADYCLFLPDGSRQPCYAPAELVIVRPGGDTLALSCAEHRDTWASRIQGRYDALARGEWEAWGAGYRGAMLGG
jgi:hypothetical protein